MVACKLKVLFAKQDTMRYISHLDLLRLFQRAARRAKLPLAFSQGFNPHPKISIKRALKLGLASHNEEAIFLLTEQMPTEEFKKNLQEQLPQGIQINEVEKLV
jgi:radical SAM-linked protein